MFLNLIGRNYRRSVSTMRPSAISSVPSTGCRGASIRAIFLRCFMPIPGVADRKHFDEAYGRVAAMQPKVMSPAIKEMRSELEAIRDSLDQLRDSRD